MSQNFQTSPVIRDLPLAWMDYASATKARNVPGIGPISEREVARRIAVADRIWLAMPFWQKDLVRNHINRVESQHA